MSETRVELRGGEKRRRPWFRAALRDGLWGTLGGTLIVVPVMLWLHEGDVRALSFGLATGLGGFAGKAVRALLDSRRPNPPDSVRVSRDWLAHTTGDAADRHVHRRQVTHARRTATAIELRAAGTT